MSRSWMGVLVVAAACARGGQPDGSRESGVGSRATTPNAQAPAAAPTPTAKPAPATPDSRLATPAPKAPPEPHPVPTTSNPSLAMAPLDTARGTPAVVGSEHDQRVSLRTANGSLRLSGDQAALVGRASGADVMVAGHRNGNTFEVTSFEVRAVDGIAATDGTLAVEGDQLVIVTADGKRHNVAHAPPDLKKKSGARVWLTGDLSKGPVSYGIIKE